MSGKANSYKLNIPDIGSSSKPAYFFKKERTMKKFSVIMLVVRPPRKLIRLKNKVFSTSDTISKT
ncbi:hypothetical protein KAJ27_15195 [bacterium]|nr:hypothetical protein [bacterium]